MTEALRTTLDAPDARRNGTRPPVPERTYVQLRAPGAPERQPLRYRRRRRLLERSLAIAVPVLVVGLWQLAWHLEWLDRRFYPAPYDLITSEQITSSDLWSDVWVSTKRMLIGFALGASVGIAVGLATGVSALVRAALEPMLSALYTAPKLALIPVFLTIFGVGSDMPTVVLVAVTVFFFVWIATMSAIIAVPEGYGDAAVVFNASRRQKFRHVVLPAATPAIFVGLRIAAGVAVLVLVGIELVLSNEGIGRRIEMGRVLLLPEQTYLGIVLASLLGVDDARRNSPGVLVEIPHL